MLDGLTYDDSEPPSIALVPPGTSWEQVHDHIKIAHDFLLVQPEGSGYAGAYWTGTGSVPDATAGCQCRSRGRRRSATAVAQTPGLAPGCPGSQPELRAVSR